MQVAENLRRSPWVLAALMLCAGAENTARGQFTTVINSPPDPVPRYVGPFTQVNIDSGAVTEGFVSAGLEPGEGEGSEINLLGGEHFLGIAAWNGGVANLYDGVLERNLIGRHDSAINMLGGEVHGEMSLYDGSVMAMSGGAVLGRTNLYDGSVMTMTGGALNDTVGVRDDSSLDAFGGVVIATVYGDPLSTLNVAGATFRQIFAQGGVNVSGGRVDYLNAREGANVSISGGAIAWLSVEGTSVIQIRGGDFRLDGVPIDGLASIGDSLQYPVPRSSVLSGILADGTPLILSQRDRDWIEEGALTLEVSETPNAEPRQFLASSDPVPPGIRQGQTLIVDHGGVVSGAMTVGWGGEVVVQEGGQFEGRLKAVGAEIKVEGGEVGYIEAFLGSSVSIESGIVGNAIAYRGATVEVRGGNVRTPAARDGGKVHLLGGDIRINGELLEGVGEIGETSTLSLPLNAAVSGVLSDGSPFFFETSSAASGSMYGEYSFERTMLPDVGPSLIHVADANASFGIRQGQTLVVEDGGSLLERFTATYGSKLVVRDGGEVRNRLVASGAEVTIEGGTLLSYLTASSSLVSMSGGQVEGAVRLRDGASLNVSGGELENYIDATGGSNISISGGNMALLRASDSPVDVSGGTVARLYLGGDSTLHVSGRDVSVMEMWDPPTIRVTGGNVSIDDSNDGFLYGTIDLSGGVAEVLVREMRYTEVNVAGGVLELDDYSTQMNDSDISISGGASNWRVDRKSKQPECYRGRI